MHRVRVALLPRRSAPLRGVRPTVVGSLLVGLLATFAVGAVPGLPVPAASAATPALALDLPSPSVLRSSPKKVFAHWVPSLPVSMDNVNATSDYYQTQYLNPDGESGKHKAYGGFLRDRPAPRPVRAESNWRLLDMELQVRQAASAGLDGFTLVLYNLSDGSRQWQNAHLLLQAARNVDPGFKIILQPDMSASGTASKSTAQMAAGLAELGRYSSAYRLADGRLVVSPFKAEGKTVDWWKASLATLKSTHGMPVAFWPLFLDERTHASAFAPISYGMSNWGNRNPQHNDPLLTHSDSSLGRVARIKARGQKWMQPVSVQDERPRAGIFDEAENTTNLRNTWKIAIDSGSDIVHLTTWSDFPEGSQMAPTPKNDWSWLDISAYYLTWFKTGVQPAVARDVVYLSHRQHALAAKPTYPQTLLMKLRGGSPARDTVEAMTVLKAPAKVMVSVGAARYLCQANAGVDACTVPLGTGKVSAKVVRAGSTVAGVLSAYSVTSSPRVQDLEYVARSSGRRPGDGENGTAATSTTSIPKILTAPSVADAMTHSGAPTVNYGTSWSLFNRGGSPVQTSYLRFKLPAAPVGTVLTGAVLKARTATASNSGSGSGFSVVSAGDGWAESTLTWNNRPTTGEVLGSIAAGALPDRDVRVVLPTAKIAAMANSTRSFAVTGSSADDVVLWGREHNTHTSRPRLELTYTLDAGATFGSTSPTTTSTTAAPAPSSTTASSTLRVSPTADAAANAWVSGGNFGASWTLLSRGTPAGISYLRFAVPAAPTGKTLTGATLRFRTTLEGSAGSSANHSVAVAGEGWSESTLTWNNRPAVTTTALGTISGATATNTGHAVTLSVAAVKALLGKQVTVAVTGTTDDALLFYSREHATAAARPSLELTFQ